MGTISFCSHFDNQSFLPNPQEREREREREEWTAMFVYYSFTSVAMKVIGWWGLDTPPSTCNVVPASVKNLVSWPKMLHKIMLHSAALWARIADYFEINRLKNSKF